MARPKPVVLLIFDGLGVAPASRANAVSQAKLVNLDSFIRQYETFVIQAAGEAVGLPFGEKGNSEVGHLNMGAGKIIYQDLPRINKALSDGSFFTDPVFKEACNFVKTNGSTLHVISLASNGAVHGSIDHLFAFLELAKSEGVVSILVHVILDGRDAPFDSGRGFVADIEKKLKESGVGRIASLSGRFYAMDRDNHWERTEKAYLAMAEGMAEKKFPSALEALDDSYSRKVYDEEFTPSVITTDTNEAHKVSSNDVAVFLNYRADRSRQLTKAFVIPGLEKFPRPRFITGLTFITMTEYESNLPVRVAFPPEVIKLPLSKVLSDEGLNQFHVAETEKYAHVTYFFNGGNENPYPQEDRAIVPSKSVESYASKPEMSAGEVKDQLLKAIKQGKYDFMVANFANPDMVGHTGDLTATVKALEICDGIMGEIVKLVLSLGGAVLITADHGNCEEILNLETGEIDKEHSDKPVPFIIIGENYKRVNPLDLSDLSSAVPSGVLADVAPTILKIMELAKPQDMSGVSLI